MSDLFKFTLGVIIAKYFVVDINGRSFQSLITVSYLCEIINSTLVGSVEHLDIRPWSKLFNISSKICKTNVM